MLHAIAQALSLLTLVSYAFGAPTAAGNGVVSKRSIPALRGWSQPNFGGTEVYEIFCTADFCCKIENNPYTTELPTPYATPVQSFSTLDASISLKCYSEATVYTSTDCSGTPVAAFNAFAGQANLGYPTLANSVKFVTKPLGVALDEACTLQETSK